MPGTAKLLEFGFGLGAETGGSQSLPIAVDQVSGTTPTDDMGLALRRLDLTLKAVGCCHIVGVQAGDPGVASGGDAGIRVETDAAKLVAEQPDAGVPRDIAFDNLQCLIGRSIITNDQLEVRICLTKDAFNCVSHKVV